MWLAFKGGMFLRWLQLEAFAKAWGGVHIPPRTNTVIFQYTQKPMNPQVWGFLCVAACWLLVFTGVEG